MKLTRYGMATLLVAFASVYLIWQGYLIPVTVALAVILAWLHWLAAVEAERSGELPHGPHGMLTVAAIAGITLISTVTAGQHAFWLGLCTLVLYAVVQKWRSANYGARRASVVHPRLDKQDPRQAECRNDDDEHWDRFWNEIREDQDRQFWDDYSRR